MRRPSRLSGGERERRSRRSASDDTAPVRHPESHAGAERTWTTERVLGPLILSAAAAAVLGVAYFVVFASDDNPAGPMPSGIGSGSQPSTEVAVASRRPLTLPEPPPTPTTAPTATPRVTPIPPPSAPPAPSGAFLASAHVCRSVDADGCVDELRRLDRDDGAVVLVIVVHNAAAGDTVGFQVSGPAGTADAGSVSFGSAGDGFAYVEYGTRDLPEGQYIVTATRNGSPVATTDFVKGGG